MHKILITKKQGQYLHEHWDNFLVDLFDGFSINLEKMNPIKNLLGKIKYYKVYVRAKYSTQKEVVEAFKRLGII